MFSFHFIHILEIFATNIPHWQDVSANECLRHPQLYQQGQKNELFNWKKISGWLFYSCCASLLIFYVPLFSFGYGAVNMTGKAVSINVRKNFCLSVLTYSTNHFFPGNWCGHIFFPCCNCKSGTFFVCDVLQLDSFGHNMGLHLQLVPFHCYLWHAPP